MYEQVLLIKWLVSVFLCTYSMYTYKNEAKISVLMLKALKRYQRMVVLQCFWFLI